MAWKNMRNKNSTSEDSSGISNKYMSLLIANKFFVSALVQLFNNIIASHTVPEGMKIAKVLPIPKKDKIDSLSDLRPISILPVIAKLLERCLYTQLQNYMDYADICGPNQFGFRKNHSTTLAEFHAFTIAKDIIETRDFCGTVLLDVAKAFDTVNRQLLANKLYNHGIDPRLLLNYHSSRNQYVVNNNKTSNFHTTTRGLLQGSILASSLFSFFVLDLPQAVTDGTTILYADDTQRIKTIRKVAIDNDLASLNDDCEKLAEWFSNNDLQLNLQKTELLIQSHNRDTHLFKDLKVNVNQVLISPSAHVKSLGLYKDRTLSWKPHLQQLHISGNKILWKLRSLKPILCSSYLRIVAEATLLAKLYYMIPLWGNCSRAEIKPIMKIYKDCKKLIETNSDIVVNWLDPISMHKYQLWCMAHKSKNYLMPGYFNNMVVTKAILMKRTRSGSSYSINESVKLTYMQRLLTSAWCEIPDYLHDVESHAIFKIKSKEFLLSQSAQSQSECECGCDLSCIDDVIDSINLLFE